MKPIASPPLKSIESPKPKPMSIEEKVRAKFGGKFSKAEDINKKVQEDKAEISRKAQELKNKRKGKSAVGNKPMSQKAEDTKAVLAGLMETGGFDFNEKERAALADILKK